jgi:hypothetical protein
MTVDNVTQVLNKVPGDKWEEVMSGGLDIPLPLCEGRYSTDTRRNLACANYYVNYHPEAEWEYLTAELYNNEEFALARESKSFMSTNTEGRHPGIPLPPPENCQVISPVAIYFSVVMR